MKTILENGICTALECCCKICVESCAKIMQKNSFHFLARIFGRANRGRPGAAKELRRIELYAKRYAHTKQILTKLCVLLEQRLPQISS